MQNKIEELMMKINNLGMNPDAEIQNQFRTVSRDVSDRIALIIEYQKAKSEYEGYLKGVKESPYMHQRDESVCNNFDMIEIVDHVLAEDYRAEAYYILSKASTTRKHELKKYYDNEEDNLVCLHLDLIKTELVEYGLMDDRPTDVFGGVFLESLKKQS